MTDAPVVHVLVPFWGLAGGVIKMLDYAEHAATAGHHVKLWAPGPPRDDAVLALPVLERLLGNHAVSQGGLDDLEPGSVQPHDVVLYTEPTHIGQVDALGLDRGRIIHLVQGTRHATPTWNGGRNFRLLHRPQVRIAVSAQVHDAIAHHVDTTHPLYTIDEGHDIDYFTPHAPRQLPPNGVRVLYNTWKSDLGDRVRDELSHRRSIRWTALRDVTAWPALRNRYHSADIFLGAPGPEEGFYLPGVEAMAAGCAVVMALVGGNAAYGEPGVNMVSATYDDPVSHAAAIDSLIADPAMLTRIARTGAATITRHDIGSERRLAHEVLDAVIAEPVRERTPS